MVINVSMATLRMPIIMNEWINIIMYDGWFHPLARTLPSLVSNLWWSIVMDWNLENNHLVSGNCGNIVILYSPKFIRTNNVGLTFSGGDTMATFIISKLVVSKTISIGDTEYHIIVAFHYMIPTMQVGQHLTTTCHLLICPPRHNNQVCHSSLDDTPNYGGWGFYFDSCN